MSRICVAGGTRLCGRIRVPGAKNAVLPVLAACLLAEEPIVIEDTPKLSDVANMLAIMEYMGCAYEWQGNTLKVDPAGVHKWEMPASYAKELRSSIFMLGPVVARFKKARFTYPGGCEIGSRPIDLHLRGLGALNVKIIEEHGYIYCDGTDMRGAEIHLDYPSVGATENIIMAAAAAKGKTILHNAAMEPEILDLQRFLCSIGVYVSGAGTSTITVEGANKTRGASFKLVPDRIAAATFLVAAAITRGTLLLENVYPEHLHSVLAKLKEAGCKIETGESEISITMDGRPQEMKMIETSPYPGFPTDAQSQFLSLASICSGTSVIIENVFENRFKNAAELARMGADITIKDRMAVIRGVKKLRGADVSARDLRGGAALVLAGLAAEGETNIEGAHHIDRGYEAFEEKLIGLGANVKRIREEEA